MRLLRTLSDLICRVLVGVLLFAQLAVSSYACPSLEQPTSQALPQALSQTVEMQSESTGAMPAGCDHFDKKAPHLCAEHCKAGQQSHDTAPLPIVTAPTLSLLYCLPVDIQDIGAAAAADASGDPLLAVTPPPHAILHCVFRI